MKKSIGFQKNKSAVFISGKGSNLKNLIKFSKKKKFPISIDLIISNNKKAMGLKYSQKYKIEKKIISFQNRNLAEKKILKILFQKKINFICLAGFMKILSKNFIKNFRGKIINIHPSLLPNYKGLNTHIRVIKNKEKYSGCTVHFVNSKLDAGKIIMQKKVRVFFNDTASSLRKKIQKKEYEIYPAAIKKIFD